MSARHTRSVRSMALVVAVTLSAGLASVVGAESVAPAPVSGPADATEPVVRMHRIQLEPVAPAPTYGGCLPTGYTSTTYGTAPNTWKRVSRPETQYSSFVGFRSTAGPRGAIVVVGDSLTVYLFNDLMNSLIGQGYGPICMDASVGRMASPRPGASRAASGAGVVERIKASDAVWRLDNTTWIVALGTNDVGYSLLSTIVEYSSAHIADVRAAIGPLRVPQYWVSVRTLRGSTQSKETIWNSLLAAPGVTVIDWSAVASRTPGVHINASDLVHLTAAGNSVRVPLLVTSLQPV